MANKVLLVDDEPKILSAFRRKLNSRFDLELAPGGPEALQVINNSPPFAVVVSDMRMPEINGQDLLCHLKNSFPETTRVMLTANTDQDTASLAINDCGVFRFLTKPYSSDALAGVIEQGISEHQRFVNERDLLKKTLEGTIELVNSALEMVNPEAVVRMNRVRSLTHAVCEQLDCENAWEIEAAAALSQIGTFASPNKVAEQTVCNAEVAATMVNHLPRMEAVSEMLSYQDNGTCSPETYGETNAEKGAQLLAAILKFDSMADRHSADHAIKQLLSTDSFVDRREWREAISMAATKEHESHAVTIDKLTLSMIIDEDIFTNRGVLLIKRGCKVTDSLRQRLIEYGKSDSGIVEPIQVRLYQV